LHTGLAKLLLFFLIWGRPPIKLLVLLPALVVWVHLGMNLQDLLVVILIRAKTLLNQWATLTVILI
jgi:hypothetical protein